MAPSSIKVSLPEGLAALGEGRDVGWRDKVHQTFHVLPAYNQPMNLWLCRDRAINTTCFYWKSKPSVKLFKVNIYISSFEKWKKVSKKKWSYLNSLPICLKKYLVGTLHFKLILNEAWILNEGDSFSWDTEGRPLLSLSCSQRNSFNLHGDENPEVRHPISQLSNVPFEWT